MKTAGAEIMVRKASELDVGSRVIIGRNLLEVVRIGAEFTNSFGAFVTLCFDNGNCLVAPAKELFACV